MNRQDRRLKVRQEAMRSAQAKARAELGREIRRQLEAGRTLESIAQVLGITRQRVHALKGSR